MINITEADANHAKACAGYLAILAAKYTDISSENGDGEDVVNNLRDILNILSGFGIVP